MLLVPEAYFHSNVYIKDFLISASPLCHILDSLLLCIDETLKSHSVFNSLLMLLIFYSHRIMYTMILKNY